MSDEVRIQGDRSSQPKCGGSEQSLHKEESQSTSKSQSNKDIRYFSMFSGVGGFELGFERANALSVATRNESRRNEEDGGSTKSVGMAPQQPISGTVSYNRCKTDGKREGSKNISEGKSCNECNDVQKPVFSCVGMSEIDKYSSQVLKYRFPGIKNWGDCTKINPEDLPDFDLLCGGFPCQAFSIAGKRRGFEDIRGTMFFEIARILKVKRPKTILLENVKGLLNHDKGKTFRVILQTLDELGYEVQWMVLNSKFFGVPQNRERVLIIGNIRGTSRPEILPFRCGNQVINGEDGQRDDVAHTIQCSDKHRGSYIQQLNNPTHSNNRLYGEKGISPALNTAQGGNRQPKIRAVLTPDRANKRQNGRRFKEPGEPSFTVTSQDIHGVAIYDDYNSKMRTDGNTGTLTQNTGSKAERNGQKLMLRDGRDNRSCLRSGRTPEVGYEGYSIRRLTPVECCRLQSFPDNWNEWGIDEKGNKVKMSDTQRYKQMGNAVTTNVIAAIGSQILNKESQNG